MSSTTLDVELAVDNTFGLLSSTLNALSGYVVILEKDGTIAFANESWRRFLRATDPRLSNDGIGTNYLALGILRPKRSIEERRFHNGLRAVLNGNLKEARFTHRIELDGELRWFRIAAAQFQASEWTRIVVAHEDVTEVQQAHQTIDDLSQRLLNLQEEERQRIAMELHDSTSQHLTALSLNIMTLKRRVRSTEDVDRIFAEMEKSVEEAQKEIRVFSYLLYPPHLEHDGLKATVQGYIEGFSVRAGISSKISIAAEVDGLAIELQRSILRIVQEALTNVHHHASAKQVEVRIELNDDGLIVRIDDDGKGVANSRGRRNQDRWHLGVGVPGMRARLRQFGGALEIGSTKRGTTVVARIPRMGAPNGRWRKLTAARKLRLVVPREGRQ
jgi:signal transduction histidine kinase